MKKKTKKKNETARLLKRWAMDVANRLRLSGGAGSWQGEVDLHEAER